METGLFLVVLILYTSAAVVGVRRLSRGRDRCGWLLTALIALGVSLESLILVFRAIVTGSFPLTGLFESMIFLTVALGLTFLVFSAAVRQVWFGAVMAPLIWTTALLSGLVAQPASRLQSAAQTPWVIAHGMAMVLAAGMIGLAAGTAALFLVSRRRLKHKQLQKLLGRMPSIEKLEDMNLFGLRACLVLMTFGLVTGIGTAMVRSAVLGISAFEWLIDAKIVLIGVVWLLLAFILGFRKAAALKGRVTAWITVAAFLLIMFAFVGTAIFCGSKHDFRADKTNRIETRQ
ncbi:MAG TPA: cytochrome c biogenesis protein CcsA [Planctomycetes bacterium]|nr:cytochrome c biogenesis protein CcsA [Planctomycetota bacterium]